MRNLYSISPYGSKFIFKDYLPDAVNRRDKLYEERHEMLSNNNFGVPNCPLGYDPVNGVKVSVTKRCNMYTDNAITRENSWIVDDKTMGILRSVNMPKYESWPIDLVLKEKVLTNFTVIHFYYDYYQEIDFEKSIIEVYKTEILYDENNLRYRVENLINQNLNINSFYGLMNWKRNPNNIGYDLRIKDNEFIFNKEVNDLDLIPYSYSTNLVSEKLKKILEEDKITCLSFSDIPFHEFKNF